MGPLFILESAMGQYELRIGMLTPKEPMALSKEEFDEIKDAHKNSS
jgi:hypothetical protein